MMLDEPYRWADAVSNRREYVEDQLTGGSPVVGLGYKDGTLLLTMGRVQQKIYEIYDRIGMASLGHPTDIEKLRQSAVDLASVVGFNYSDADVTLQQIVHFGLGPAVKTSFDEVYRSPFIVRILLAELDAQDGAATFYTVDYDGAFQKSVGFAVLGGNAEADKAMQGRLDDLDWEKLSLAKAMDAALISWAAGRWMGEQTEIPEDEAELEKALAEADLPGILKAELESLVVEAAVFDRGVPGKCKYRQLTDKELASALKPYRAAQ
jgi:proteasome alpha subunit